MRAAEVARVFRGKKIARDKWIALCPAHPDRHPSLTIRAGKTGVLLACMSHQCDFLDIVRSAGLKPLMLRYDYDPENHLDSEQVKAYYRQRRLEALYERERRIMDLQMIAGAVPSERTQDQFEWDLEIFCAKLQP